MLILYVEIYHFIPLLKFMYLFIYLILLFTTGLIISLKKTIKENKIKITPNIFVLL